MYKKLTVINSTNNINTTQWVEIQEIESPNTVASQQQFGTSVSIYFSDVSLEYYSIIGAPYIDDGGLDLGAVFMFHLFSNGSFVYISQNRDYFHVEDAGFVAYNDDEFGTSVDASNECFIGGIPFHNEFVSNSGSAYIICGFVEAVITNDTTNAEWSSDRSTDWFANWSTNRFAN